MGLDREAARRRCWDATPGPWEQDYDGEAVATAADLDLIADHFTKPADAAFVAHARTDLSSALDLLDKYEHALTELLDAWDECTGPYANELAKPDIDRARALVKDRSLETVASTVT